MAADPRKTLIIVKGEDKTPDVRQIARKDGRAYVTYNSGKTYPYALQNVKILSDPELIKTHNSLITLAGNVLSDVSEVLRFGDWVKIFHGDGSARSDRFSEMEIFKSKAATGRSKDVVAYFGELAESTSLKTEDGESLLAKKFKQLNLVSRQSILSYFLKAQALPEGKDIYANPSSGLIFPFGCNMSQKIAVHQAMLNPLSLIQGPPGTGKTQTILNLISNMLLQGKKVAVVSNNNSATANVLEKLEKYDLGFLAAFLGSAENKKLFISGQSEERVQLPALEPDQEVSVKAQIAGLNAELDEAFRTNNELADVVQQMDALQIEITHFDLFHEDPESRHSATQDRVFFPKVSTQKLLWYWLRCESKPSRAGGLLDKIQLVFRFGMAGRALFETSVEERIPLLQNAYYLRKMEELESSKAELEHSLAGFCFDEKLEQLTVLSMELLRHFLAKRYSNRARNVFKLEDLWKQPEEFLKEYPVVLSTTFSVITSVQNGYLFDCVIVDEASQVDLVNGVLAMACASTFVVVGDEAQLPNVLTNEDRTRAKDIARGYEIPSYAQFERHNLLTAVRAAFPEVPETLLREHYRCHPKIIQFCNQKFYGGELLVMTRDQGEDDVIKAYVTVEGSHARGTVNQRQVDEILQSILPELKAYSSDEVGIISPFRAQTSKIRASVSALGIEVDTVHKYQGREKRVIIISTVANKTNDFVDDPNMLNVAISRAQEKLRLVVSKEMAEGSGNLADFVKYISYSNGEVVQGKVRSVFDLLYREYTATRLKFIRQRLRVSEYDSENLAYCAIEEVLTEGAYREYSIALQFPLSILIKDKSELTTEEAVYAFNPWTKADFLIYKKVDKSPVLVIEVDGYAFHREGSRQAERDVLKDSVLNKVGVPILRLSTTGSNEKERVARKLKSLAGSS
jgi:DNA polymerase III delta prime subunit